ncbi:MAG: DUF1565 domain-containing protein [Candidatus Delongbacteria bacterium]|nr:DUF1565 domain-containing protein [Candidatus Delongbacteria bacterium]
MAIDGVSPEGDTVVVAPGSYVENIDYHGRNIFLTSLYYLEGDESYIEQTVIDGGQNGSVITFIEGEERSAVLNGFTITNGSGRLSGGYTTGGGIFIDESSPSLTNCLVTGNNCAGITGGGGIFIYRSSVHLSNLTIRENSAQSLAGGLRVTNSEIEMDSLNRCNIYLNEAASANDVFVKVSNQPHLAVFLDTATVAFHSDYFIGGDLSSVDILHGKLEPAQHDLWVSPDGDNNNSGSSPDDPLKTITYALHIIDADSLHPLTINLMPGTFSLSGGQSFPFNLRSYVSLVGSGRELTILDLEHSGPRVMVGMDMEQDYTIRSMSILNTARPDFFTGIAFTQNRGVVLEDVLFSGHESTHFIADSYYDWMSYIDNTSLTIRNCDFIDNNCIRVAGVGRHAEALVQNCRFENNTPLEDWDPEWEGTSSALGMVAPSSSYPYPFYHRVENCVFTNNAATYTDPFFHFSTALNLRDYRYPLDIVNCTFADNSSLVSGCLGAISYATEDEVRLVNCLFWDNELYEFYIDASTQPITMLFSHNIIQDMEAGMNLIGNPELIFVEGNFSADPLFMGSGEHPYQLTEGSPAIDAGIAFWVVDGDTVINLSPDQYEGGAPDIGAYEWEPEVAVDDAPQQLPGDFAITSIHPNPFNNSTLIKFNNPRACQVELVLYTITGRLATTLIDAWVGAGEHSVQFSADDFASGVYVVKLESKLGWDSRLLTLVK